MYYFRLQQDKRFVDGMRLEHVSRDMEIYERNIVFVKEDGEQPVYLDFIDHPRWLVSDRMKGLLEKYDRFLRFYSAVLTGRSTRRQDIYWFMEPGETDSLSERTQVDASGACRRLVLAETKVRRERIFRVAGVKEDILIVRLDVAESLQRRGFTGLHFTPVELA
ncbi:hypothetical protein [Paenibacillus durus]|uniref:Uncharacterized protein n=1 Tax=Paenibacillus durus TaxID=44251 RepID=A0A089HU17_PAEDU|nr:hypothetical protein [Paenibacillus durus]AIQ13843.1 hypothetical protein PDUR_19445 [Paenibacillus durus]